MEQLSDLGVLRSRAMFGGHGLYLDDTFFGILYNGCLYFKTDAQTREAYTRAGSEPFRPNATQTLASYHEVPARVIEDAFTLREWASEAAAIES